MADSFRIERDPLGELDVPADAYYGVQTARAVENFPISGLRAPADLIVATILVKKAAAEANAALGRLAPDVAGAIRAAADEILSGTLRDQFVVDVYQAGAGTSHNMNANEVLANRAGEILGEPKGTYTRVHPNDHVNMGQSTNDVFPTATRLALLLGAAPLVATAHALADSLGQKADEFADVLKTGRTHLQDAVPITLGQEFSGYAECVRRGAEDVAHASEQLEELNIGATAVGTGLNAGEEFRRLVVGASGALHQPAAEAGGESLSRHAEHGRRARVFERDAAARGRSRKDRQRPPAAQHGSARRVVGDRAAGGAARVVDHARQGQPVGAGDGQPGVLPGDGLRPRRSRWPARPDSSSST